MKAATIDRFGPPSVLKEHEIARPEPSSREVLIAVYSAGVGVWDAQIRDGWWPEGRPKFPIVLGSDGAGVVVSRGAGVRRFKVGDRVWAYEFVNPKGGFYAEYVAVNAEHVGHIPRRLDLLHAGGAAVTGFTALQGVDEKLRIRAGETVLIFGASGAVGSLAVQFAKRRRARVIGTASGAAATKLVSHLGADGVFDARKKDAIDTLRQLAPDGLDAVLACAGGEALNRCLRLVRAGGRIAFPNGIEPEPRAGKGLRVMSYDAQAGREQFARLERAVNEAKLQVPIAAVYPLAEAAKAHRQIEEGRVVGRIVLRTRPGPS